MTEQVFLDGQPLSTIAAWGNLTYSERLSGGCWEASWDMEVPDGWHHPAVRRGADVEIRIGGLAVWSGTMSEPDRDSWTMTAQGYSRQGEDYPALDATGAAGRYIGATTEYAVLDGLPWNYRPITLPSHANPVVGVEAEGINAISTLWDAAADAAGMFWGVGPDRVPYMTPRPTEPTWHAVPGSVVLGVADDDYRSHLYGRYLTASLTRATAKRGDDAAATRWGRKYETVDLIPRGVMDATKANSILDGMLAKIGPRPGFSNALELGPYEITGGGSPAFLPNVRTGQMIRCHGIVDDSLIPLPYLDIIVSEVRKTQGGTVYIEPLGLAARNLSAVLEGAKTTPLVG